MPLVLPLLLTNLYIYIFFFPVYFSSPLFGLVSEMMTYLVTEQKKPNEKQIRLCLHEDKLVWIREYGPCCNSVKKKKSIMKNKVQME